MFRYSALLALAFLVFPVSLIPSQATARPIVEVAFVLDTTGSMAGLIEGAKRKIWSIATSIIDANPAAEIRMGLVAYRDIGDDGRNEARHFVQFERSGNISITNVSLTLDLCARFNRAEAALAVSTHPRPRTGLA